MAESVEAYIRACDICQQHEVELLTPSGLLCPLPIPNHVWEDISMDFIDRLSRSEDKSVITVVVDRLSKFSHFVPMSHPYTATQVVKTFFGNILQLYGMPQSIVCDRDTIFITKFWQELFRLQGVHFKMSSAYHPQTNGQTKVVNRTLEMYLHCFCSSSPKTWTQW